MQPTILVVEDDRELLEVVSEALTECGFTVHAACDGLAALCSARASKPTIILLDAVLPRMSGLEFRARQSRDPGLADVPVVVMTGLELRGVAALKAEAVLVKPFGLGLLVATVVSCLATSTPQTSISRILSFVAQW
jgi:DNA-binding response OmpR family regulator